LDGTERDLGKGVNIYTKIYLGYKNQQVYNIFICQRDKLIHSAAKTLNWKYFKLETFIDQGLEEHP